MVFYKVLIFYTLIFDKKKKAVCRAVEQNLSCFNSIWMEQTQGLPFFSLRWASNLLFSHNFGDHPLCHPPLMGPANTSFFCGWLLIAHQSGALRFVRTAPQRWWLVSNHLVTIPLLAFSNYLFLGCCFHCEDVCLGGMGQLFCKMTEGNPQHPRVTWKSKPARWPHPFPERKERAEPPHRRQVNPIAMDTGWSWRRWGGKTWEDGQPFD